MLFLVYNKNILGYILALTALFSLSHCKDKEDEPKLYDKSPYHYWEGKKLFTGKNTAEYLADGKYTFIEPVRLAFECIGCGGLFYEERGDSIYYVKIINDEITSGVVLFIPYDVGPKKYNLLTPKLYDNFPQAFYYQEEIIDRIYRDIIYYNDNEFEGEIEILRNDSKVLSGTFEFVAKSEIHGGVIEVKEGKFNIAKPE